jgi:hypothetical protein
MNATRVVPLLILAVAACSASVAPKSGVTLLVNNDTCGSGQCDTLDVEAFPGVQTGTPGGQWHLTLGTVTSSQACFTLPSTAKFLVVDDASHDTTTIEWSDTQGISLAAVSPNAPPVQASPTTRSFVPATAAAWAISLPSGSAATAAQPCTPSPGPAR